MSTTGWSENWNDVIGVGLSNATECPGYFVIAEAQLEQEVLRLGALLNEIQRHHQERVSKNNVQTE